MLFDIYNIPPYPTSMFMFMKRDIFLFTVIVLEKIISRLKNSNFKIENVTSMAKFFGLSMINLLNNMNVL